MRGYEVKNKKISDELLRKAIDRIRSNFDTIIDESGLITPETIKEITFKIKNNKNLNAAGKESDFVVEVPLGIRIK